MVVKQVSLQNSHYNMVKAVKFLQAKVWAMFGRLILKRNTCIIHLAKRYFFFFIVTMNLEIVTMN